METISLGNPCTVGFGNRTIDERVFGVEHPLLQTRREFFVNLPVRWVFDEVLSLVRI